MKKELEEKIIEYIKKNGYQNIKIYTNYRDFDNIEYLLKDHKSLESFEDAIIEAYEESEFYEIDELRSILKNEFEDLEDLEDKFELTELLYENVNIIYPIKDFLHSKIKIDLLCDFYDEANYDFTSNGWIRWLVNNQGYTMKELKTIKENNFLKSVRIEANETFSHMNALTFLLEITIEDYFKILDGNYKKIKIDKKVTCGAFDCWNGSGSNLSIELEKDIFINKKNINRILIEKTGSAWNYTVDQVYGLIGSCWIDDYKVIK